VRRTPRRPPVVLGLVLAGAVITVAGCSGPVDLAAPSPTGPAAPICRNVISNTPDVVAGQQRREVAHPSPYTAAWGDPAITLVCGVTKPPGLNAASECFEVNGVGWYSEKRQDGYLFTTIGRKTYAQVMVPNKYVPSDPLVDLSKTISDQLPQITKCV
jgi:hypothetical protein